MKILVCVKQVSDFQSEISLAESGKWLKATGSTRYEMNPFDAYALEEALLIKERFAGVRIDAVSVGPKSSADTLRRALGMGADEGVLILDRTYGFRPPTLTATWIAAYAASVNYDLILTGVMSADEANGQTGPMIGQILAIPCATATIHERITPDKQTVAVEREIEGGARDRFDIRLPCVLTIQSGINTPRYPALSKVLRAKKKNIATIDAACLGTPCRSLNLHTLQYLQKRSNGVVLEGTTEEKVLKLLDILENKPLLR